jgi:hypothetical protein
MVILPDYFLIPCFNDGGNLDDIIKKINSDFPASQIIVVDDGSEPPIKVTNNYSKTIVLRLSLNCGVGTAIKTGLIYARNNNARSVVTLDADGQHSVSEVQLLLNNTNNCQLTIGVRKASTYNWGKIRKFAHNLLNVIVSKSISQKITDSTSGFRLLLNDSIDSAIKLLDDDYLDDTALLLVRYGKNGTIINEVPVQMNQRIAGKPSQNNVKLVLLYLSVILRIFLEIRRSKKWS